MSPEGTVAGRKARTTLAVIMALLTLAAACSTASPPESLPAEPTPAPTPDPAAFDVVRAMGHVRALAVDIGRREAGGDGDRKAREYVVEQLGQLGWRAVERPFPLPQGGETANVFGVPPRIDRSQPWLLFGGHLDSLGGPGANDNATGIAVALEVARALTARRPRVGVGFVAFAAEERQPVPGNPNHLGSISYVRNAPNGLWDRFRVFVNLDMVGNGDVIYCARLAAGPTEGTERCLEVADEMEIPAEERITPNWSDNGTFLQAGLNAAWLWTGEVPCCYHNELDTIDNVNPDDLERVGRLALAMIRSYTRDE